MIDNVYIGGSGVAKWRKIVFCHPIQFSIPILHGGEWGAENHIISKAVVSFLRLPPTTPMRALFHQRQKHNAPTLAGYVSAEKYFYRKKVRSG